VKDLILTPLGLRVADQILPCVIGKHGVSKAKREGDGRTPIGKHQIVGMLYRPDRLPKPRNWALPIRPRDIWSDDVKDPDYNLMGTSPSSFRHEKLFRSDHLYDLVIITNWNWPYAVKGRGSAIFIHHWRQKGYPTEGCIALSKENLVRVAKFIDFGSQIIVPETLHAHRRWPSQLGYELPQN
jgi:L,D-peptidoglycan transpeptidase YkuD (ErfK/YbiS/YcfS/YnhG family)